MTLYLFIRTTRKFELSPTRCHWFADPKSDAFAQGYFDDSVTEFRCVQCFERDNQKVFRQIERHIKTLARAHGATARVVEISKKEFETFERANDED